MNGMEEGVLLFVTAEYVTTTIGGPIVNADNLNMPIILFYNTIQRRRQLIFCVIDRNKKTDENILFQFWKGICGKPIRRHG